MSSALTPSPPERRLRIGLLPRQALDRFVYTEMGGIRRSFRILREYLANSRWVGGISSRSQTNFRGDQVLEHIA